MVLMVDNPTTVVEKVRSQFPVQFWITVRFSIPSKSMVNLGFTELFKYCLY